MHPNETLLTDFYIAFQQRNYTFMQRAYHEQAAFRDPVFGDLGAEHVKMMWQMLLTTANDLTVSASEIYADDAKGGCHWEAWYTFSRTGRKVHNVIEASFIFQNGQVIKHVDSFDLWRWSRQALGVSGLLLGWSPLLKNKVRAMAKTRLQNFMTKEEKR